MAERRMFSKKIIDTDWFMDMPASTQNLYFHLSMRADDDGFVGSPARIIRMIGASNDDYKILISKKFIIPFDSGVCVIRDWRIHNYIQADRYVKTTYTNEKNMLSIDKNKRYTEESNQNVYIMDTQDSIDKDSIDKNNKEIYKEICDYLNQKTNSNYRSTTSATQRLIKARLNDGFKVEDFKKVIDIKCSKWLNDEKMKVYLRPETLFGTKFESYLNEKEIKNGNNGESKGNAGKWNIQGTVL